MKTIQQSPKACTYVFLAVPAGLPEKSQDIPKLADEGKLLSILQNSNSFWEWTKNPSTLGNGVVIIECAGNQLLGGVL